MNSADGSADTLPSPGNPPRQWIRTGFFFALGVALMLLVAVAVVRFAAAALDVSAPFLCALTLAMLLDPIVDRLERAGATRLGAVALVFIAFLVLLIGFCFLGIPKLIAQGTQFAQQLPAITGPLELEITHWLHRINTLLRHFEHPKPHVKPFQVPENADIMLTQILGYVTTYLQTASSTIATVLSSVATVLIEAVITLILLFYLLVDIDRLRARLLYLTPERRRAALKHIAADIGDVFASYLRGLLIVCGMYGVATILLLEALSMVPGGSHGQLAGYALLIGALAGVLYSVPYLGALTIAVLTFLVGFGAGGIGFAALAVGLTFALNQVFDNIISPRVIGGGVGLHPVLALFALTVGGELFQVWGLLLAVPIAASIQVVLFRIFPKLTTQTPDEFLDAAGVLHHDSKSAKTVEGDRPRIFGKRVGPPSPPSP